jgi:small multidrug resistance family-3 protein
LDSNPCGRRPQLTAAIIRLWAIDGERPGRWDLVGACVTLIGMAIILFAPCGN